MRAAAWPSTRVLSALRHPNIPRILHLGTHDEQTFAVTDLCPGSPASSFMRPDNYLRPDEVVAVGLQLAGALAAVHAAGVVYRDLHPGNVLIDRGDPTRAWIFDFDQAQVSAEFYAALTERWATPPAERTEPKRGKPLQRMDYAAPEVRAGAAFTAASDVYALGLLLYRLLTGRRPFPVTGGEPRPPRELCIVRSMRSSSSGHAGASTVTATAPDRRPWRVPAWALGLTGAACLMIGRATVPRHEPDMPQLALPARLTDEGPEAPTPSLVHTPRDLGVKAITPTIRPDPKPVTTPRLVRREAVTHDEAVEAAQHVVSSLRDCTGVPRHITADLDIVRDRGVVKALNHHAPAPDDPDYPWHGCAQRSFQRVRFPVSETAGPVQVRLTLR